MNLLSLNVKQLNRLCLIACAPFIGMVIWLLSTNMSLTLSAGSFPKLPSEAAAHPAAYTAKLASDLDTAHHTAAFTAQSVKKVAWLYTQTNKDIKEIVIKSAAQAGRPRAIYDRRITRKLGSPSGEVQSGNLNAQLYYVPAQNFKGYALKVKLKSDNAMQMVLGYDKVGAAETTLSAVERYSAVAGVNAGGFADNGGKRYPLSTTVVGGKYVTGFEPTRKDLFFVGLNNDLKLIGGNYKNQHELDAQKPKFGASFVPILMKNGVKQPIPEKWRSAPSRAPRTIVANYKDDQLLFLVTDGQNERGGSGATLEEVQILLSRLGAKDAYNLDGGGSSSLIFNGRVVNHPSDGRLRGLATHFLFFK
jgi:exopolysaccharide biosynthesis protein